MDESILITIKKMLGVQEESTVFDTEIISAINGTLSTLRQLGVGPKDKAVSISDELAVWSDLQIEEGLINLAKNYIYRSTRLQFDPPTNSFLVNAIKDQMKEDVFRLNAEGEGAFDDNDS